MSDKSPLNSPIQWFFNACLLILLGVVALSVAVHLLQAMWWWVLGIIAVVATFTVAVIVWRLWRKPW